MLWTVAHQAPLSMEFSRQEYWSGLPHPSLGDLPDQGSNPCLLSLLLWQVDSLPLSQLLYPNLISAAKIVLEIFFLQAWGWFLFSLSICWCLWVADKILTRTPQWSHVSHPKRATLGIHGSLLVIYLYEWIFMLFPLSQKLWSKEGEW